ncbi:MAG: phytanoyl-CoA dioxygenase family protein [Phycisphaeraceae bacterium]|nr:phytanoyl-CoA dioxygenase family protein [Phycisphaeraceae bacterium]
MLEQSQVDTYNRDGYLNAGPILADSEIAELSDELDRLIATGPDGFKEDEPRPVRFNNISSNKDQTVWQIVNVWEASPAFERLVHHPFIVNAIRQMSGFDNLQVWHDQMQYKPAGYGGCTGWHQDAPLWPIIRPMTPVSAWIPFDDADEDNGCMWMVPGSHKWDDQNDYLKTQSHLTTLEQFRNPGFIAPAQAQGQSLESIARPVRRGEVHFHHSLTWHGSPTNTSNRPRRAVAIHYMTSEAVFLASGEHPMKQFVNLPDGAHMSGAGSHFPVVCRDGKPCAPCRSATCGAGDSQCCSNTKS